MPFSICQEFGVFGVFRHKFEPSLQAGHVNVPRGNGRLHSAARFGVMGAIIEAAVLLERVQIREGFL